MASEEFDFLVKTDLSKYAGKYISIAGKKVVASGRTAKILEKVRKKFQNKAPLLAKIPTDDLLIFHPHS